MSKLFLRDMAERAISTYLQSFLGLIIVSGVTDLKAIQTAAIAAIPAALSVVKSLLAQRIPGTVSPASVAGAKYGGGDFQPSLKPESFNEEV